MERPSIALIGCGAAAESYYLPALKQFIKKLCDIYLVDKNLSNALELAKQLRVSQDKCIEDYSELLDKVNGVIVAVPHHLHYPISKDFLRSNVHVLCEKPLAETPRQIKELIEIANSNGVTLSVNNTRRLFPAFKKVKELLETKTIGDLISIYITEGGEFSWSPKTGFYFTSTKGVLFDKGAHILDLVCWWLNRKPNLDFYFDDSFGGSEAVASLGFTYQNCTGSVFLSWLNKLENKIILEGDNGKIICEVFNWKDLKLIKNKDKEEIIRLKSKIKQYSDFGKLITQNFLNVIKNGISPLIPGGRVKDSIELINECYLNRKLYNMSWMEVTEGRKK